MIKSIARYAGFFSSALFHGPTRRFVYSDLKRYAWNHRPLTAETLHPWSDVHAGPPARKAALDKAVQWLLYAQRCMKDDGIGSFRLPHYWSSSYIETTGYIVPTLLQYGTRFEEPRVTIQAIKAADWLLSVQKPSGGWQGGRLDENRAEVVFNTAQVIRGLYAAYTYTGKDQYLTPAIKACQWLCTVQDPGGFWVKNAFMGVARAYDSYVAAPLLQIALHTGNEMFKTAAIKNLDWIVQKKQTANGWFADADNTIKKNDRPILHTLAYTIDGLLESGLLLQESAYIDAAARSADRLFDIFNKRKYLKGRYDANWKGSEHTIVTGCAQISIVWMKLYLHTQNIQYLNAALKMNDQLIYIQTRNIKERPETQGALPGSWPVWGRYEPFGFPNWATKYFADALMLEAHCLEEEKKKHENRNRHI